MNQENHKLLGEKKSNPIVFPSLPGFMKLQNEPMSPEKCLDEALKITKKTIAEMKRKDESPARPPRQ